ncbi:HAD hydrolase-like protein [Paenibacillus sp. 5J-6]|uniref:HAD hydrolase-like protein n=1 Tax=Paenibacillus silvestris TaxID=2606219 RepID=A0A6L8V858_9BACL|nr:HAD hydrolase-like protein [Paenibacillus silvestris]MZQ86523.1 HAD hydrolase-like protein [Paenibacillus silvestris]
MLKCSCYDRSKIKRGFGDDFVTCDRQRHCGVTLPDACVMVGDNLHTDIAGGRAAGIRTLWLCGEAMDSPGIPAGGLADFAVPNLLALVSL